MVNENNVIAPYPVYIRYPAPGTDCPYTGIARAKMLEIVKTGKVRVVNLAPENSEHPERGVKLIHFKDLVDYLDSVASVTAS